MADEKIRYSELVDAYEDQQMLIEIARDLMQEHNLERLLRKILEASRRMTGADAGSIYLAEEINEKSVLRFKYSYTSSRNLPYEEFTIPRTVESIAGYVSLTGEVLNIKDVYKDVKNKPYKFNKAFDKQHGYRTKSILTVPMNNHDGKIVGVLQLINSKESGDTLGQHAEKIFLETPEDFENKVAPFKMRYESLMQAVAAQAAIALENAAMLRQIRDQFDQFVSAAVEAVEARDPATRGHSFRVAAFTCSLAQVMNEAAIAAGKPAQFSPTQLKELEYAGILHDFGKVYINPTIFMKAKKLYPEDKERLELRYKYLRRSIQYRCLEQKSSNSDQNKTFTEACQDTILQCLEKIEILNEPALMKENPKDILDGILSIQLPPGPGLEDEDIPLLTEQEYLNLCVERGSLNPEERKEIERHVELSYDFVKRIPWPQEFAKIPAYIRAHHEMLDGSGYPDKLKGDEIPLQARMLAVADIFDALSASDRPYKKAVPIDKACAILQDEATRGKLDAELVNIFCENVTRMLSEAEEVLASNAG